ncbi:ABC transporter permease [Boudabousia marimammalium]|uniref:ABC3 transporter permease C-terminal domain-containing protein n=1 Tax=Boudabousia marimammalium TaxID=156892 RepID=A0A1Q5PS75_9ACTO|nr:ABC transporter permease [Boudabousia marimammalium]OKL50427.1 hypothetical protein BM477_00150 [Boudabousia marimammalium]
MKLAWKMAWRDARRHLTRTILATLLIAVPISAGTAKVAVQLASPSIETVSLKDVPAGAQARILAQPYPEGITVKQPYHGQMGIQNYMDKMAASAEQIAPHLNAKNQLWQFWLSPNVLAKNDRHIAILKITEAQPEIMPLIAELPADAAAQLQAALAVAPSSSDPVPHAVLNQSAANYLHAHIGDQLALSGAPAKFDGGQEGAFHEKHFTYQVAGIVPDENSHSLPKIWAAPGWVKDTLTGVHGVFGNYVVTGTEPVTWPQIKEINRVGAIVFSRDVILNPPPESERYPVEIDAESLSRSLVDLAVTVAIVGLLALFLLTPAFTVSAEQAARSLAMIAVAGGTGRQLRRIITRQGSLVGLLGGVLGALGGLILGVTGLGLMTWQKYWAEGLEDFSFDPLSWAGNFTWWLLPVAVLAGLLCGWISSLLPAIWVNRNNLLETLTGYVANAHTRPRYRFLPPLLLLAGVGAWASLLIYTRKEVEIRASSGMLSTLYLLSGVGTVLVVLGLVSALPHLFHLLSSRTRGSRVGLAWRLAARDATIHRRRVIPVASATLMVVMLYVSTTTTLVTWDQWKDDVNDRLIAQGRILIAPKIPLEEDFNRELVDKTRQILEKELPIVAHADMYNAEEVAASAERLQHGGPQQVKQPSGSEIYPESYYSLGYRPGESCPPGLNTTLESRRDPTQPLTCTRRTVVSGAGIYGDLELPENPVLTGDAMRATGVPGAEEAAKVLDAGGVVVSNGYAYNPATGQAWVSVNRSRHDASGSLQSEVIANRAFPGAFVYNLLARTGFVPSPELAKELGYYDAHLYGQILVLDQSVGDSFTQAQLEEAWSELGDLQGVMSYLVPKMTAAPPWWMLHSLRIGLLGLLFATVWISLALSRTQMQADMATLSAVGAPPGFARRYATAQAGLLLLVSTVLGAVAGFALSWARFRLQMNYDDGVYRVVIPWADLLVLAVPAPLLMLSLIWLTSRVRLPLSVRSRD